MNDDAASNAVSAAPRSYRVLARKYRPAGFDGLIGQEALVRTLANAFRSGRLAHAFMLSGVRGVGKTTTARIIARALNCIGADAAGGPTASPCGACDHCRAIAEDRHLDVLEMDAASRTGVDDIRELIDGVRYRPVSGRYKVYIIDEVHMLSRNAFNALLKTLEEPPEHVRFVFATTEIRKVPVTVLSRCQRFDLRRVEAAVLVRHMGEIAEKEGAVISEPALQLIARAADGSVRDALSLLDQAIAHAEGEVGEDSVRQMLGLADRGIVFDVFEAVMAGSTADGLRGLAEQYASGADPAIVLEDMLELTHWLTRIKITPEAGDALGVPEVERTHGRRMADALGMGELTRAWQILLKGLGETRLAPVPIQAAEMTLVRLAYAARLPTPAEALQAADQGKPLSGATAHGAPSAGSGSDRRAGPQVGSDRATASAAPDEPVPARGCAPRSPSPPSAAVTALAMAVDASPDRTASKPARAEADPTSFEEVAAVVGAHREVVLQGHLVNDVHLVHFEPGRIEIRLTERAPHDLSRRLSSFLSEHTTRRWLVSVSSAEGEATLYQQSQTVAAVERAEAASHPLVRAVLEAFPGATIAAVRSLAPPDADGSACGDSDAPPDELPEAE